MRTLAIVLSLGIALPAWACEGLKAENAWIPAAPPGATVRAGYVTLKNTGHRPLKVDEVSGADFGDAELHRMSMENSMMHMQHEPSVTMPAGGTVRFEPGGLHIMLFEPKRELNPGDRSRLTFRCGTNKQSFEFIVKEKSQ